MVYLFKKIKNKEGKTKFDPIGGQKKAKFMVMGYII